MYYILNRILIIDIIHNLEPLPIYEFNDDDEFINVKLIFKNEHYKNTFLDKLTDNKICKYCDTKYSAYTHMRRHLKTCKSRLDFIKDTQEA